MVGSAGTFAPAEPIWRLVSAGPGVLAAKADPTTDDANERCHQTSSLRVEVNEQNSLDLREAMEGPTGWLITIKSVTLVAAAMRLGDAPGSY